MRMCTACEEGRHWDCGMQTWCECDCDGPEGVYLFDETYISVFGDPFAEPAEEEELEECEEEGVEIDDHILPQVP